MLIGPFLGTWVLWRADLRAIRAGDRQVARAYLLHALGIVPVAAWLAWAGTMPVWAYLAGCWLALAILRIRTFLEHQAHERAPARSVIIEDRGPLALLFLNNNLHAVHHAHPKLPWYRLPAEYARRREEFLQRNGGYRYGSYAEVFVRHFVSPQGSGGASDLDAAGDRRPRAASGDRAAAAAVTGGLAALPMYDWPEVTDATDRLWAALRDALRAEGIAAPEALARDIGLMAGWTDPGLVLGQTCGLPYVRELAGRVALIGAADYGVEGCAPGWYRSAVVVRADDPRETLDAFRGARLAVNGRDSQSGYGAILHHAAPLARDGRFFGGVAVTGAHAASVPSVADGSADIAAIDLVSWRLCRRYLAEAGRLRVLLLTDPTPGLPYIAAAGRRRRPIPQGHRRGASRSLDSDTRETLGIVGFVPLEPADYAVIADRLAAAEARLRL